MLWSDEVHTFWTELNLSEILHSIIQAQTRLLSLWKSHVQQEESAQNVWTLSNYSMANIISALLVSVELFAYQFEVFRAIVACFCKLYYTKLYLYENCFFKWDSTQSVGNSSNYSIANMNNWTELFDYSFQSEVFSCQIELFRTLEACFWQLEKIKLYSSQKCSLSSDSCQNVLILPN